MDWLKNLLAPYTPYLFLMGVLGIFLTMFTYALLRTYIRRLVEKEEEKTKELLKSLV